MGLIINDTLRCDCGAYLEDGHQYCANGHPQEPVYTPGYLVSLTCPCGKTSVTVNWTESGINEKSVFKSDIEQICPSCGVVLKLRGALQLTRAWLPMPR